MYYAELNDHLRPKLCFSFDSKRLRDEWVNHQQLKYLSSTLKKCMQDERISLDFRIQKIFFPLNSRLAFKKYGVRDGCGDKKMRVHRHIKNINDNW